MSLSKDWRREWIPPTKRGEAEVETGTLPGLVELVELAEEGFRPRRPHRPHRPKRKKFSNEEIMLRALEKRGSLTFKLVPFVRCADSKFRALRGSGIIIKGVKTQGQFWKLMRVVKDAIVAEGAIEGVTERK